MYWILLFILLYLCPFNRWVEYCVVGWQQNLPMKICFCLFFQLKYCLILYHSQCGRQQLVSICLKYIGKCWMLVFLICTFSHYNFSQGDNACAYIYETDATIGDNSCSGDWACQEIEGQLHIVWFCQWIFAFYSWNILSSYLSLISQSAWAITVGEYLSY